jgi:hypothetical protein
LSKEQNIQRVCLKVAANILAKLKLNISEDANKISIGKEVSLAATEAQKHRE